MPNAYIEIYTDSKDKESLQWVESMSRVVLEFQRNSWNLEWSGVYSESYQEGNYIYVHLSALLKHEEKDAYMLMYEFLNKKMEFIESRSEHCHILLTPQASTSYKDFLDEKKLDKKLVKFPIVGDAQRFAGYSRTEVILSDKKTGFSVIANDHRNQYGNTDIAGQYLHSRIEFYKKLPKDAIWY